MIRVNGKVIEQNRFPDGTLAIKGDFKKNSIYEVDIMNEVDKPYNYIDWYYDSDSEMFTIMCILDIFKKKWL